RRGRGPAGERGELLFGIYGKAVVLTLGDHQPSRQLVSKLRRQRESPLVIQARRVGPEKHLLVTSLPDHRACMVSPVVRAPHYPTFPHFQSKPRVISLPASAIPQVIPAITDVGGFAHVPAMARGAAASSRKLPANFPRWGAAGWAVEGCGARRNGLLPHPSTGVSARGGGSSQPRRVACRESARRCGRGAGVAAAPTARGFEGRNPAIVRRTRAGDAEPSGVDVAGRYEASGAANRTRARSVLLEPAPETVLHALGEPARLALAPAGAAAGTSAGYAAGARATGGQVAVRGRLGASGQQQHTGAEHDHEPDQADDRKTTRLGPGDTRDQQQQAEGEQGGSLESATTRGRAKSSASHRRGELRVL